nr:MAG TPA: GDSL like Lipase Acylhydrolase [Caudoviricetes sp.]
MAKTTDELFAEATEADYETAEPVTLAASDTEEEFQFRIDEHLRTIAIPEKGVVAGVEGDLNVNIARFTMTRYYHGRDLSKLNIRINYRNANGQVNYYTVSDATVSGDSIVFSWEFAADVTQYKGNVQFVVYLFSATNAVLKQRFFTTLGTLEVLEGLEVDSSIPVSEQTDILLHLKKDLSAYAEEVKKSLPADYTAMTEQVNSLKEDLSDIDYIVFKDKINKLAFNSEGSSSNITLNGNTITSINATKEQYKAFINTSLFENGKKYIVVMKFKNDNSTNITVYANAFSYAFQGSIGKTQSLGIGKSETSVMPYTAKSDIRGFSIYSTTENASYTVDIYIYDVTDKDISNIDFSVGGTKIKILKSDLEKPYFGKILCTYGDSITAQQTWQDYVQRELGFSKYYNHGVGGRRLMAMATDECLAEITEDFDVILVMGGTNDWAQDRTIGAENDINTDDQTFTGTFYGGLNALMKKLTTKYPTKRIVFMTQTPVKNSNGENFFLKKGSADGLKNSNGNTTRDFAKATLNACGNNHVPCIDLNSLVGWNENNISSFVLNENDMFFHPTSIGGKRMAECISGFLESIQSIN